MHDATSPTSPPDLRDEARDFLAGDGSFNLCCAMICADPDNVPRRTLAALELQLAAAA